jgi:hypothetical protein
MNQLDKALVGLGLLGADAPVPTKRSDYMPTQVPPRRPSGLLSQGENLTPRQAEVIGAITKYFPTDVFPQAVPAIMGNIDVETGGSFDYKQKQYKGGPGRGLFQMEKPMQKNYNKFLKDNELENSVDSQIFFLKNVLDNPEIHSLGNAIDRRGKKVYRGELIQRLFRGQDPSRATKYFMERFLNPNRKKSHLSRRLRSAQKYGE